jgi:hypothetical chaperone protein
MFDRCIIEALVLDHFGRGSTWGADGAPFPHRYTDPLIHWHAIPQLDQPETLNFLRWAQLTGSHPARVRALETLLVNNHALRMIHAVEQAKITLSDAHFAVIRIAEDDIDVWQPLTRAQFAALIGEHVRAGETCVLDTLGHSGLDADEIDAVVRTGGSAQIPCLGDMLTRFFGADKLVFADAFTGVAAGLAIRAASPDPVLATGPTPVTGGS